MSKIAKKKPRRRKRATSKQPEWSVLSLENLEEARLELRLSKAAWVKRLEVAQSTYHAWLSGKGVPHPSKQRKLLKCLDAASGLKILARQQAETPDPQVAAQVAPQAAVTAPAPLSPEVADTLRAYVEALMAKGTPPAQIPALVTELRVALS